ncbi:MAG: hypothetical protein II885_18360 [Oscillospiraceae bacterium]|nr:hypothetical protein [Oscillospiraceae bacterium]
MVKNSIRVASFFVALFSIILVFKYSITIQQQEPFGTNERFELIIPTTAVGKEQLVLELNALVDQYNAIVVKVVPSQDNPEHQKDVVWFGSKRPDSGSPQIEDDIIIWLEPSCSGTLICSSDIGIRPFYGSYAMRGGKEFRTALKRWCSQNGINIEFYQKESPIIILFSALTSLGIGNTVLISFVLLLTTIIAWFSVHGRMRALRLLGGTSLSRIHFEDSITVNSLILPSLIAGGIAFTVYLGLSSGINRVYLMLLRIVLTITLLAIIAAVFVLLLSIFVRPMAKHISTREIPLKRLRLLGRISLVFSCVIAMLIVPLTIVMSSVYLSLSKDYVSWKKLKDAVCVSYNDVDGLYEGDFPNQVEYFFEQMSDNLCISLAIDRAILLNSDEMGPYDHIVLTDRAWLAATIDEASGDGVDNLTPIEFNHIHNELREFLMEQLPLWTRTGEATPEGMAFYEFSGENFLVLPPSVGQDGSTIQAKKPLIILVDDAVKVLNCQGLLLPLSSSGNVIFKNEKVLREVLSTTSIQEKISSINSFTEVALGYAQVFQREALYCFAACVLCLITMGAAEIMSAQLWIEENKRRIFTLHTAGNSYMNILIPVFQKEAVIIVCAILTGGLLASISTELKTILYAIAILFPVYMLLSIAGYILLSKQEFLKLSFRRDA